MANVKTAVSLDKDLFEEADNLAREMKTSRSALFARALEEFIQRHQNRRLLERINAAYGDAEDESEQELRRRARNQQRRIVKDEW